MEEPDSIFDLGINGIVPGYHQTAAFWRHPADNTEEKLLKQFSEFRSMGDISRDVNAAAGSLVKSTHAQARRTHAQVLQCSESRILRRVPSRRQDELEATSASTSLPPSSAVQAPGDARARAVGSTWHAP